MALVTPATCWKTPWTPQKQPPARMATSAVACGLAGSSSIGGGISRALSAPDGKPRSAMPAPSNSAAKIDAGQTKRDASGTNCLPEAGLNEADDCMWHIRRLQRGNLVGRKCHVHRCESVVEMVQLGGTDDRRGDDRLGEQPGQCHLRPRNAARSGNLGYAIDDLAVCLGGFAEESSVSVVGLG